MVKLHMSPTFAGAHVTLGPAPWFKLVRNVLYEGFNDDPVGELSGHQWNVRGRHFAVMQADPRSSVHFETALGQASTEEGPFDELYLVDGSIYGDQRLVAQFDDHNRIWRDSRTLEAWPIVVVTTRRLATPAHAPGFANGVQPGAG